jgi:pimeloyl-ACP methyl ester carboxylesterase
MFYSEYGDGPTIVALHAATVDHSYMGWLVHAMLREGFNVIAPDLRGHGQSANSAPDMHLTRMVDDVLEFAYLLGRTAIHGFGYSLGGAVMLYAASQKPDMFRSLVLLASNYHAPSQHRIDKVVGSASARSPMEQVVFDPETGAVASWDAPLESFKVITCPTLIVAPDRDEFNALEDAVALYHTLPNAEILVLPKTSHFDVVRHPMVYQALSGFYSHVPRVSAR